MDWGFWLPLLIPFTSLMTAVLIFPLPERSYRTRTFLNILGASLKIVFVGIIMWGVFEGRTYEASLRFVPGIDLLLRVDPLSLLFVSLSSVLWLVTTIYAIGYLADSPHLSRFFGFFSLCVTATMGIALAGNLPTFFIFYELLTLTTYPLVVHTGTPEALSAGRKYLVYTLTGGAVLLIGVVWVNLLAGPAEFTTGGVVSNLVETHRAQLRIAFAILIGGLGVKTALVPLHGWLPSAMVAPAPVSALLHAVAVVKAGAFGIVRVVYDIYGMKNASELGVLTPLAIAASITIVYGSLRALPQNDIKRRLAYSTVSQVSYIVLGAAIFGPLATTGGLVHLIHQGLMKITLFFCAGSIADTLGVKLVSDLNGVGRRMPFTMMAFSVGAFGMIGVPPIAGFISKWYLGLGGIGAGQPWVVAVLAASTLLNAAYFLPMLYAAWFRAPAGKWKDTRRRGLLESRSSLLFPPLVTALLSLAAGLLAGWELSPLSLAIEITEDMYAR